MARSYVSLTLSSLTVLAFVGLTFACSGDSGGDDDGSNDTEVGDPNDPLTPTRQKCLDKINALRKTESLDPYTYWKGDGVNECADRHATEDENGAGAHGTWKKDGGVCKGNAQNECLGHGVKGIESCLDMMWKEKDLPECADCDQCRKGNCDKCVFQKCGHYLNMSSRQFTQVVCGFNADGGWAVQNFK